MIQEVNKYVIDREPIILEIPGESSTDLHILSGAAG